MKTYLKLSLTAAILVAVFGLVGPLLVSIPSDEPVIAGFAMILLTPVVIAWLWRREIDILIDKTIKEIDTQ